MSLFNNTEPNTDEVDLDTIDKMNDLHIEDPKTVDDVINSIQEFIADYPFFVLFVVLVIGYNIYQDIKADNQKKSKK